MGSVTNKGVPVSVSRDGVGYVKRTKDVTVLSSFHGRLRRVEREIEKIDLQAAVKYGKKELARPDARTGAARYKFTHGPVVFVTDSTCKEEITSYVLSAPEAEEVAFAELDGAPDKPTFADYVVFDTDSKRKKQKPITSRPTPGAGLDVHVVNTTREMTAEHMHARSRNLSRKEEWTSHTVVVVDQSGSMRKTDVPGGGTRSDAVWLKLAVDFVEARLTSGEVKDTDVFSIVSMNSTSTVLVDRQPMDWFLYNSIIELLRSEIPKDNGNYLPALQKAEELLLSNTHGRCALALLFLSDGKPSDDPPRGSGGLTSSEKMDQMMALQIDTLAARFGRRLTVSTIGFAGPEEDFRVLKTMASRPKEFGGRGIFQATSLDPEALGLAFSSLASSLTTTRTELTALGGSSQRPVRDVRRETPSAAIAAKNEKCLSADWFYYAPQYVSSCEKWEAIPHAKGNLRHKWTAQIEGNHLGVAMRKTVFGEGAERMVSVFRLVDPETLMFVGPEMVAKQSRFIVSKGDTEGEDLKRFHQSFCATQTKAQEFAEKFNKKLATLPGFNHTIPLISFLECFVYVVWDELMGKSGLLVEKMVDPLKYTKWNDNCGHVEGQGAAPSDLEPGGHPPFLHNHHALNMIEECDDEEELFVEESGYEEDNDDEVMLNNQQTIINVADIPQAFSHFTYRLTKRKKLVCDLQGVLTTDEVQHKNMFRLTDPVIHHHSSIKGSKNKYGRTDRGKKGMYDFIKTHKCTDLCHMLKRKGPTSVDEAEAECATVQALADQLNMVPTEATAKATAKATARAKKKARAARSKALARAEAEADASRDVL